MTQAFPLPLTAFHSLLSLRSLASSAGSKANPWIRAGLASVLFIAGSIFLKFITFRAHSVCNMSYEYSLCKMYTRHNLVHAVDNGLGTNLKRARGLENP